VANILVPIFIPLIFYAFIATLVLTPIYLYYRHRSAAQRLVSDALAKGQPIDPEVLARLIPPVRPTSGATIAFWFTVPGIIFLALAIGLGLAALYLPMGVDDSGEQLAAATVVGCMGIGFLVIALVAALVFRRRPSE
jgi:hypothetical protein